MGRHKATGECEAGNVRRKRLKLMSDDLEDNSATPLVSHEKWSTCLLSMVLKF